MASGRSVTRVPLESTATDARHVLADVAETYPSGQCRRIQRLAEHGDDRRVEGNRIRRVHGIGPNKAKWVSRGYGAQSVCDVSRWHTPRL